MAPNLITDFSKAYSDDMAPSPDFDVYKSYFDDPTFSDLTIRLSDKTIMVDRRTLCRRSKYFEKLILGPFKVIRIPFQPYYQYFSVKRGLTNMVGVWPG